MSRKLRQNERAASGLLEEATHLLRSAPARLYLGLYLGAVPFVLGFLYFWTDMSKGAQAGKNAAAAAFTMTLLFIWMKTCQAFFSCRLREHLLRQEPGKWLLKQWLRAGLIQAAWQPTGFLVLPFALLIALPFGWTYAFYRNLTIFGTGSEAGFSHVIKASWHQATMYPRQNHALLSILFLFGLFVFINSMHALLLVPFLLKTLFGVESVFTRAGFSTFNTTLLAVSWGISYLVMEPLVNAVYTLRCFYGESITTGEDIKSELAAYDTMPKRGHGLKAVPVLAAFCTGAMLLAASAAYAETGPADPAIVEAEMYRKAPVSSYEIDKALEKVLKKRQYQWRMPRVEEPEKEGSEPGWLEEFFTGIGETLKSWGRSIADAIERFFDWLADILPDINPRAPGSARGRGLGVSPDILVLILIFVIGALGGLIAYRIIRQGRTVVPEPESPISNSAPDIENEETLADELHRNEWLRLASDLMDRGEERLALRALYLACLAHLADIHLINIAAYKSNKDYLSELVSRAHALPGLFELFSENVRNFERVWYGSYEASSELLRNFNLNNQRMFEIAEHG